MIEQLPQQPTKWYDGSAILLKLGIIAIIILALLIPSSWIQDLVTEREGYQKQMQDQITHDWAGSQLVQGPVLALPYKQWIAVTDVNNKAVQQEQTRILYVLPQNLQIKADVKSSRQSRGVYDAITYNADVSLQGDVAKPDLNAMGIDPANVQYDKARIIFGITDINGLKNTPSVKINGQEYSTETASGHIPFSKGLQVNFPMQKDQGLTFSYRLDLKGSNDLLFMHLGKTTNVEMTSDWTHPVYNDHMPDDSGLHNGIVTAKWHMSYFKRPFPQQWTGDDSLLMAPKYRNQAIVGATLKLPINQYREVMRTTKYSTLIILLTFVSLFLTELIRKQRVHLFNYTLIGAAMIVYYTLLLSFAEQLGYNWSYLISSVATIGLITWFTASLLKNSGAAGLFSGILTLFYGFIFVLVRLEELSLLVGSVALFLVVAALMYFSRKINWDQH